MRGEKVSQAASSTRRLELIERTWRKGQLREARDELVRVYDARNPADRALMAVLVVDIEGPQRVHGLVKGLLDSNGVSGLVQARACIALGVACRRENRPGEAVRLFERATHLASKGRDAHTLCLAQLYLLVAKFDLFGPATLGTLPDDAWRSALASGDSGLLALWHCRLAGMEGRRGALDLARRHLDLALQRLAQAPNPYVEGHVFNLSTTLAATAADLRGALQYARRALELSERSGDRFTQVSALGNLCHVSVMVGQLDEAAQFLTTAEALVRDEPFLRMCLGENRAHIQLIRGQLVHCEQTLAGLVSLCHGDDFSARSYAGLELATTQIRLLQKQGRSAAALEVARAAVAEAAGRSIPLLEAVFTIHSADTLVDLNELDEATRAIEQATRSSALASFGSLIVRAELECVRGRILAGVGEVDAARRAFERSIRVHDAIGHIIARDRVIEQEALALCSHAVQHAAVDDTRHNSLLDEDGRRDNRQHSAPLRPEPISDATSRDVRLEGVETIAGLMAVASRPDLLGLEAYELLMTSGVATRIALIARDEQSTDVIKQHNFPDAAGVRESDDCLVKTQIQPVHPAWQIRQIQLGKRGSRAFLLLVSSEPDATSSSHLAAIETIIRAAVASEELRADKLQRSSVWTSTGPPRLDGGPLFSSPRMLEVFRQAEKVAASDMRF